MSDAAVEQGRSFPLFGSRVRILALEPPVGDVVLAESLLRGMHSSLTRFEASELSRLNEDERTEVPVSPLLARALAAAQQAAILSGGLVDVTVLPDLERAGYGESRVGVEPADLSAALAAAPPRRPAAPAVGPEPRFHVDVARATVTREPGVRIDLGGIGKGLAADLAAEQLGRARRYAVDCGGDARVGGREPLPRTVAIFDPFAGAAGHELAISSGAVATSGLATRIWRHGDGFAHHLIDPSSGAPAWTGVVQATALAPTAVEAEALAKAALLSGPEAGLDLLRPLGGALITDAGELIVVEAPDRAVAA